MSASGPQLAFAHDDFKCACVASSAYDCWARRYRTPRDVELIDNDGGPCQCSCHDADDYDDGVSLSRIPRDSGESAVIQILAAVERRTIDAKVAA